MKRAVLYLRVSTIEQTTANQERELREVASRMGCEIVHVYKDHGISGAKGRATRRSTACAGMPHTASSTSSWLGRWIGSAAVFRTWLASCLHALRVDLFLHQQGLDTTTPAGNVFAEFERAILVEDPSLHTG
ncbi:MAG TPA: recombinase family protein [Steroidobacteraceae bacterium]|jgi:hypothetical protein|nr:recombinase family protein [Steroidobacteraceae bacterium]